MLFQDDGPKWAPVLGSSEEEEDGDEEDGDEDEDEEGMEPFDEKDKDLPGEKVEVY